MDLNQVRSDIDRMEARFESDEDYFEAGEDLGILLGHASTMHQQLTNARQAIVMMAKQMAKSMYRINTDEEYWRLFVPREGQIALGWRVHEWHTPDDHDCRDNPSCVLCDLAVCRVCGLYEGGLTTECPGESVNFETSENIYKGKLDFRDGQWVEEYGPHRQSGLLHQEWKRNRR